MAADAPSGDIEDDAISSTVAARWSWTWEPNASSSSNGAAYLSTWDAMEKTASALKLDDADDLFSAGDADVSVLPTLVELEATPGEASEFDVERDDSDSAKKTTDESEESADIDPETGMPKAKEEASGGTDSKGKRRKLRPRVMERETA